LRLSFEFQGRVRIAWATAACSVFAMIFMVTGSASSEPASRLFLQQVSPHGAIVKWRGDPGQVCYARKLKKLSRPGKARCVDGILTEGNHFEAQITGLKPEKIYFYSVAGQLEAGQNFQTAPKSKRRGRGGRHGSGGRSLDHDDDDDHGDDHDDDDHGDDHGEDHDDDDHGEDHDDDDHGDDHGEDHDDDDDDNVHMWIVGDSGTVSDGEHPGQAAGVRDGFYAYNAAHGGERLDLFLMLGDNAYTRGTDHEFQAAVFELYRDILKQTAVWSTIGNHEMGVGSLPAFGVFDSGGLSVSSDPGSYSDGDPGTPDEGMPYLDIFSFPTAGEVGGVPSGTEQYYSFNHGPVHVVSLDSQLTARDPAQREAMRTWLIADLSSNRSDWTVVIFHHPTYSYGSHNSDSDSLLMQSFANYLDLPMVTLREEFIPIFDDYGVDVVYGGHSHSYERSYYLGGYTGDAVDFDPAVNAELNSAGEPAMGNGPDKYTQVTASGLDDKTVYTVAGNSGKASSANPAITPNFLQFPAHVPQAADPEGRRGLKVRGSVVLDAGEHRLRARMIDSDGAILDEFTILRSHD